MITSQRRDLRPREAKGLVQVTQLVVCGPGKWIQASLTQTRGSSPLLLGLQGVECVLLGKSHGRSLPALTSLIQVPLLDSALRAQ